MSKKRKKVGISFYMLVIAAVIIGVFVTLGTPNGVYSGEKKSYFWGNSPFEQMCDWYRVLVRAANYYALDHGNRIISLNPNMIVEAQIRDIRYMVALGVDGLLICPTSATGIVGTLEWAVDKGIPVVTYDADADTPKVLINIRVSNKKIGELAAQGMINAMKADGVKLKGKVLLVSGSTTNIAAIERRDGAKAVLDKYPGIETVVYMIEGWSTADAKKTIVNAVSAWGPPLGVVACNAATAMGVIEGLKSAHVAIPRGKPGHIYVGVVDVEKPMKGFMHEGLCDVGIDQPNLFYATLGQYFLQAYLEKGEDAIPPVGVTVTSDPNKPNGPQPDGTWNIYLTGETHEGVNIYKYPTWAPAPVVEHYGHRWLQVRPTIVTPENCEELPIWSNVVDPWLK